MSNILSAGKAALLLGIHVDTLRNRKDIPYTRTPGGHRRYRREDLEQAQTGVIPRKPKNLYAGMTALERSLRKRLDERRLALGIVKGSHAKSVRGLRALEREEVELRQAVEEAQALMVRECGQVWEVREGEACTADMPMLAQELAGLVSDLNGRLFRLKDGKDHYTRQLATLPTEKLEAAIQELEALLAKEYPTSTPVAAQEQEEVNLENPSPILDPAQNPI